MWDKKLKNRTIKKKLSRWMTVVCSFLLAVGLGFSVGSAAAEYFPESGKPRHRRKQCRRKKYLWEVCRQEFIWKRTEY